MRDLVLVGFSTPKSKLTPVAWLIRLFEKTKHSHTFLWVPSKTLDRVLIYEATASGVFFKGATIFLQKNKIVSVYPFWLTQETKKVLLQRCIDYSGKPYGKLQLLGVAVKRLANLFGFKIKNPFSNENKAFICTELVAELLKDKLDFSTLDLDSLGLAELEKVVSESWAKSEDFALELIKNQFLTE